MTVKQPVGSIQRYTMRELNQRTAAVMQAINDSGQPAAITRRGRFVAIIYPVVSEQIEAVAFAAALDATMNVTQVTGERTASGAQTAEEVANELDVNWRP